jgi:hypothetical protein
MRIMENEFTIPLVCPFTNSIIFDDDGYNGPLPETLVYYYLDADYFLLHGLEVVDEISGFIQKISEYIPQKKDQETYLNNLKLAFPWLKDISDPLTYQLVAYHPLIRTILDPNDYSDNPCSSNYFPFSFALKSDQAQILDDFKILNKYLVDTLDL